MTAVARPTSWIAPLAIAGLVAIAAASLGGALTDTGAWYRALNKPTWQPPDWLFGPVWTVIYALTAVSAAAAWRAAPDAGARRLTVLLYGANAVLNVVWSLLFFHLQRPDWAMIEVVALWLSIAALIAVTSRWSRLAGVLLLPYLAWVSFAAVLNLAIVRLN
jgi:translocator protein